MAIDFDVPWWSTSFTSGEAEAAADAIRSRRLGQGPIVRKFETQLEQYLGVSDVIAVTSGSDALLLSLIGLGVEQGDEVLVPKRSWIATAHAVHHAGGTPIFVETTPDRLVMDIDDLKRRITPRTRAIVPVHVNGRSAPMDDILQISEEFGLDVIEDAAQALGSRDSQGRLLGTRSHAACFSLSVAKVISSGQGGFIATNNSEYARRLRNLRTHGVEDTQEPREWVMPGFNFRMTDYSASIGIVQLSLLPERLCRLKKIYDQYSSRLKSSRRIRVLKQSSGEVGPYIEALVDSRDDFKSHLACQRIETRPFYPDLDTAAYWSQSSDSNFDRHASEHGIYLPSGPSLTDPQLDRVISAILEYELS